MPDPIQHVVVLMLENNSFDRMLGGMKSVYPGLEGPNDVNPFFNPDYPDTSHRIDQRAIATRTVDADPGHDLDDVLRQINGGDCMGFVRDFAQHAPGAQNGERDQIMAYFKRGDLPVLHQLAGSYAICDKWFSSVPGPTWPNRFFVHSGTSLGHVDMPEGIFHPAFHIYDQTTVFDRLHERNIPWRIYYGDVPQSLVLTHLLQFPLNYRPMDRFQQDAAAAASEFPSYVFIEPCYFGAGQNDQHPPTDVMHGEALIAQVYNSIRNNEELWRSTLLIVTYDEHGGFFDHVPPPKTVPPDDHTTIFAFDRLGVRVPTLLISPWVEAGVLHTDMDHTSVLKYLTDRWDLGPLGERVHQASSFAAAIARTSARLDCPKNIAAPAAQPNNVSKPLNAQQLALAAFTQHLEINETKAPDHVLAAHARAMASTPQDQARAASERVQDFFAAQTKAVTAAP